MATQTAIRPNSNDRTPLSGGSRRQPPTIRTASGFSGRRFCRIFPNQSQWILQIEHGGWAGGQTRKKFPTLAAAVVYAVDHGLSYRVVHASSEGSVAAHFTRLKKNPSRSIDGRNSVSNS